MAAKLKSLQMWCKRQCEGYRDVEITNLTSSWKSGLAFCAIIHRYRPDLIDYDSLSKENVYENNKLAFDVAQEHLDIPALLDPEDMVAMAVPDKLCIVTYLSQYYNTFSKMEPAGGPGIKQCHAPSKRAAPSSGQPSAGPEAKKITPSKQLLSDQNGLVRRAPSGNLQNGQKVAAPSRQGTYGDTCSICHHKVYLMERHIEDGQLYHRRCLRDKQKSVKSPTRPKQDSAVFQWPQSNDMQNKNKTENNISGVPKRNNLGAAQKASAILSDSQLRGSVLISDSGSPVSDNRTPIKQSQNTASSSLVKMLYGVSSPYPGSGNLENKVSETHRDTPLPASRTSVLHKQMNMNNGSINTAKEKPLSIMERAAMFNADSKPRFGMSCDEQTPVSGGVKKAPVSVSRVQTPSANSKSEKIDTVTYTYHSGGTKSVMNLSMSQTGSGGDVRSGLLQSLANIRRQRDEDDGSGAANHNSAPAAVAAAPKAGLVDGKGTGSTFLGHRSALSHQSKEDGVVVSSSQRTSTGEVLISQSADSKKSILKSSSSGQSCDSSCHKDMTPKTILKPRLNENTPSAVVEDQPKPILKSKRSSEESSEFDSGLVTNPRPILKSSSPTEPGQLMGSSPPKSILKSRETSPESGHKPAKSILKSKDSVDDMEVDEDGSTTESKPKSILKHSHDSGAHARDELIASPIRSILKHAASHPESRSILKSPVSPEMQKASIKNSEPSNDKVAGSLITANSNQRKADVPTHSSRAQIKLAKNSLMPQPAPRKNFKEDVHTSSDTMLPRPAHPPSLDKVHSAAVASAPSKRQPQPTPRSILKTSKDTVGAKPELSESHWEKPVPEATKSVGTPSMSSSISQSVDKGNGPINNFSAFNLNDSLLIHSKNDDGSAKRTTMNGNQSAPKSAWQIELEARKRINMREGKGRAPPRPSAPPAGAERYASQTGATVMNSNRDYKSSALMRDVAVDDNKRQLSSDKQFSPSPIHGLNVSGKQEKGEAGNKPVGSPPPRPPPPIHHDTPVPSHDGQTAVPQKIVNDKPLFCADVRHSPTSAKANLNRCPAFRIPDSPQSSPESKRNDAASSKSDKLGASSSGTGYPPEISPEMSSQNNKRKIVPDTRFSFRSGDFGKLDSSSPTPTPDATYFRFASHDDDLEHNYPGVFPSNQQDSPPKRRVNAEARVATLKIMHDLETLDKALQILEKEGRSLEEKIRSVSDDDMDEDSLMVEWFEMINKKNELVRKESELMYKKRQQELEDLHMDLEYELRLLMEKPDNEKTASDRIRENTLIQELLETVNQRNHIVDSMEEDRKRYIAEDQEIADMMAKTGLVSGGVGKKKKNDKRKPQKKMDHHVRESPKSKIKDNENNLDKVSRKDRKHFKLSIG